VSVAVLAVVLLRTAAHVTNSNAIAPPSDLHAGHAASAVFAATVSNSTEPPGPPPEGMVWIPGGEFSMGSHAESESMCARPGVTRDALPVHRVYVDGFWMDATEVTNAEFARFVKETGHLTIAERTPTAAELPGVHASNLVAGSVVFTRPTAPVTLENYLAWWRYQKGASWHHPEGPSSSLRGRDHYPVVHVALRGRRRLFEVGEQAFADRSRVGVCRTGWSRGQAVRMGRRPSAVGRHDGQHPPGPFSDD
jgi:formylglycine-generating enzyme required for sulfatase activity